MNPWGGMLIVFGAFGVLMSGLALYQRVARPDPEWLRKLTHMGMGVVTLSFPWLFSERWPVLLMAGLFVILLMSLRWLAPLRERYGRIIGGVTRQSYGEVYFPIAVGFLFYFSGNRPLFYCVPILILTFADALSALIGVRYGRTRYTTDDGHKSVEGSVTFFLVAFLSVLVPLLVYAEIGRVEILLIALCIGMLTAMIEASAWRGLDNLVLPLAAFIMLEIYVKLPLRDLALRGIVMMAIVVFMICWRRRTTLKDSALLGAALGCYLCWAVGGWRWLLPPLMLVASYSLFWPQFKRNTERIHDNHVVVAVSSMGLIWLLLFRTLDQPELYFPFTLTFAVHLAIIAVARWKRRSPHLPARIVVPAAVGPSWVLIFGPYLLAQQGHSNAWLNAGLALLLIALGTMTFYVIQPRMEDCPNDMGRWVRQTATAALASAGAAALLLF